jgi:hypothetical protein
MAPIQETPDSTISDLSQRYFSVDTEIWNNLKCAIASSSGFQRWLLEAGNECENLSTEQQVQRYLRETLETLAY